MTGRRNVGKGEFIGGVIGPGSQVPAASLFSHTARPAQVEFVAPPSVIGRNMVECIQSALVLGNAAVVDGIAGGANARPFTTSPNQSPATRSSERTRSPSRLSGLYRDTSACPSGKRRATTRSAACSIAPAHCGAIWAECPTAGAPRCGTHLLPERGSQEHMCGYGGAIASCRVSESMDRPSEPRLCSVSHAHQREHASPGLSSRASSSR